MNFLDFLKERVLFKPKFGQESPSFPENTFFTRSKVPQRMTNSYRVICFLHLVKSQKIIYIANRQESQVLMSKDARSRNIDILRTRWLLMHKAGTQCILGGT